MSILTTIYLIRHGEIDNPENIYYGRTIPVHLSLEGKESVRKLAEYLNSQGEKIENICTSPLPRTIDTSKILAKTLLTHPSITIENDFNEVDIPALVGHSLKERDQILARGIDEYGEEFIKQGNESRKHVIERMKRGFEKVRKEDIGKTIAVVSHGDPLAFLCYSLTHPDVKDVPSIGDFVDVEYPEKGGGYKVVTDKEGKVISIETLVF